MIDAVRQEVITQAHTVVVKIGTNVLARADGKLDLRGCRAWLTRCSAFGSRDAACALVSSGAIGAGIGQLGLDRRPSDLRAPSGMRRWAKAF